MEYVLAFPGRRGGTLLGEGATRERVAAECREAALAFMSGVASGWDKVDLVLWLTGPYAHATRHVPRGERATMMTEDSDVDPEAVEELLVRVRAQLLASLEKAALSGGSLEFAMEAMDRGLLCRAADAEGEAAWVPVDNARMRLRDRVRSLFAADYLNDPSTYEALFVCHHCEGVLFDAAAKKAGVCVNHKRLSGIVPREPVRRAASDDE